ncbi:MAG: BamA/TamA family outer membrane protein [Chitinophagales bacterium]|nr:BamA/TamA family outer membrane protein [Chitinophagales bacterium]
MTSFFWLIILFLSAPLFTFSQDKSILKIHTQGSDNQHLEKKFKLKEDYSGDAELQRALQSLVLKLQSNGYIEASVDSQQTTGDASHVYLHVGNKYEWAALDKGNIEDELLQQIGFKEKFYNGTSFNYKTTESLLNKIVTYHENNGYPFAQVKLDSIAIEENKIAAALFLDRRQLMKYDTIALHGETGISKRFLYSYLGIKPKGLYNESNIRKANKRISELSFLQQEQPMQVLFQGEQAKLHFYLKDKQASRFDFLLGILPNNDATGKVLITGEVLLDLVSAFGRGEQFFLNWKRLQARTQSLDVAFKFPYLLSTPIGVDFAFNLYKRDTIFLDLNWEVGFQYLFAGGNYFKAFVQNKMTNVLNVDTNVILNTRTIPAVSDVRNTLFGVEYFRENLDYRINPKKGYSLLLKAGAGTRKIDELSEVIGLNDPENPGNTFASLYDSVDLKTVQYKFDYRIDKYWQLGKRSTVKTTLRGGALVSDNVFENEMYRIGGNRLLRGFDEESIFSSLFNVVTLEYRFLLSKNSHFNFFFDGAYTEYRMQDAYRNDFPFGFGAGLAFETKAGLFGVSYALGRQQNNPVDFKSAKIHFGYVNYF